MEEEAVASFLSLMPLPLPDLSLWSSPAFPCGDISQGITGDRPVTRPTSSSQTSSRLSLLLGPSLFRLCDTTVLWYFCTRIFPTLFSCFFFFFSLSHLISLSFLQGPIVGQSFWSTHSPRMISSAPKMWAHSLMGVIPQTNLYLALRFT